MSTTLIWIQAGGCGGDSMSLLNATGPGLPDLVESHDLEVLWHPSFSAEPMGEVVDLIVKGEVRLDILCLEGAILRGPRGTGAYDSGPEGPKKNLINKLAHLAGQVVAVGTCACFGGIGSDGEAEATGLQYLKWQPGGFLGESFRTHLGNPVINLPGCPCHPAVICSVISTLVLDEELELTPFNTPRAWYGLMVHQGCTRNEYHEYQVEENHFGQKGCLFFHLGCHGPLATGPCNKVLWNDRNSKTRAGVPCFGCTRPDFPQPYPFFSTRNIEGIPLELPDGVDRAHYMAYKGMAAAAAPRRLKDRKTDV